MVLGYGTWLLYALLPAAVTLLLAPWLVSRLCGPGQVDTSAVRQKAREELALMGPLSRDERILIVVFLAVVGAWVIMGGNASVLATFGAA